MSGNTPPCGVVVNDHGDQDFRWMGLNAKPPDQEKKTINTDPRLAPKKSPQTTKADTGKGKPKYRVPCMNELKKDSDEEKKILEQVEKTAVYTNRKLHKFNVQDVSTIQNEALEDRFKKKQKEFKDKGYKAKEYEEQIAFSIETEPTLKNIIKDGLRTKRSAGLTHTIGHKAKGVQVWRNIDLCMGFAEKRGYKGLVHCVMFKYMTGVAKAVIPKVTKGTEALSPTPGYDCHIPAMNAHNSFSVSDNSLNSQVFLYELDSSKRPVQCPSHCLPIAAITYSTNPVRKIIKTPSPIKRKLSPDLDDSPTKLPSLTEKADSDPEIDSVDDWGRLPAGKRRRLSSVVSSEGDASVISADDKGTSVSDDLLLGESLAGQVVPELHISRASGSRLTEDREQLEKIHKFLFQHKQHMTVNDRITMQEFGQAAKVSISTHILKDVYGKEVFNKPGKFGRSVKEQSVQKVQKQSPTMSDDEKLNMKMQEGFDILDSDDFDINDLTDADTVVTNESVTEEKSDVVSHNESVEILEDTNFDTSGEKSESDKSMLVEGDNVVVPEADNRKVNHIDTTKEKKGKEKRISKSKTISAKRRDSAKENIADVKLTEKKGKSVASKKGKVLGDKALMSSNSLSKQNDHEISKAPANDSSKSTRTDTSCKNKSQIEQSETKTGGDKGHKRTNSDSKELKRTDSVLCEKKDGHKRSKSASSERKVGASKPRTRTSSTSAERKSFSQNTSDEQKISDIKERKRSDSASSEKNATPKRKGSASVERKSNERNGRNRTDSTSSEKLDVQKRISSTSSERKCRSGSTSAEKKVTEDKIHKTSNSASKERKSNESDDKKPASDKSKSIPKQTENKPDKGKSSLKSDVKSKSSSKDQKQDVSKENQTAKAQSKPSNTFDAIMSSYANRAPDMSKTKTLKKKVLSDKKNIIHAANKTKVQPKEDKCDTSRPVVASEPTNLKTKLSKMCEPIKVDPSPKRLRTSSVSGMPTDFKSPDSAFRSQKSVDSPDSHFKGKKSTELDANNQTPQNVCVSPNRNSEDERNPKGCTSPSEVAITKLIEATITKSISPSKENDDNASNALEEAVKATLVENAVEEVLNTSLSEQEIPGTVDENTTTLRDLSGDHGDVDMRNLNQLKPELPTGDVDMRKQNQFQPVQNQSQVPSLLDMKLDYPFGSHANDQSHISVVTHQSSSSQQDNAQHHESNPHAEWNQNTGYSQIQNMHNPGFSPTESGPSFSPTENATFSPIEGENHYPETVSQFGVPAYSYPGMIPGPMHNYSPQYGNYNIPPEPQVPAMFTQYNYQLNPASYQSPTGSGYAHSVPSQTSIEESDNLNVEPMEIEDEETENVQKDEKSAESKALSEKINEMVATLTDIQSKIDEEGAEKHTDSLMKVMKSITELQSKQKDEDKRNISTKSRTHSHSKKISPKKIRVPSSSSIHSKGKQRVNQSHRAGQGHKDVKGQRKGIKGDVSTSDSDMIPEKDDFTDFDPTRLLDRQLVKSKVPKDTEANRENQNVPLKDMSSQDKKLKSEDINIKSHKRAPSHAEEKPIKENIKKSTKSDRAKSAERKQSHDRSRTVCGQSRSDESKPKERQRSKTKRSVSPNAHLNPGKPWKRTIHTVTLPEGALNVEYKAPVDSRHFHGRTLLVGKGIKARTIPHEPIYLTHPLKPSGKPTLRPVDPRPPRPTRQHSTALDVLNLCTSTLKPRNSESVVTPFTCKSTTLTAKIVQASDERTVPTITTQRPEELSEQEHSQEDIANIYSEALGLNNETSENITNSTETGKENLEKQSQDEVDKLIHQYSNELKLSSLKPGTLTQVFEQMKQLEENKQMINQCSNALNYLTHNDADTVANVDPNNNSQSRQVGRSRTSSIDLENQTSKSPSQCGRRSPLAVLSAHRSPSPAISVHSSCSYEEGEVRSGSQESEHGSHLDKYHAVDKLSACATQVKFSSEERGVFGRFDKFTHSHEEVQPVRQLWPDERSNDSHTGRSRSKKKKKGKHPRARTDDRSNDANYGVCEHSRAKSPLEIRRNRSPIECEDGSHRRVVLKNSPERRNPYTKRSPQSPDRRNRFPVTSPERRSRFAVTPAKSPPNRFVVTSAEKRNRFPRITVAPVSPDRRSNSRSSFTDERDDYHGDARSRMQYSRDMDLRARLGARHTPPDYDTYEHPRDDLRSRLGPRAVSAERYVRNDLRARLGPREYVD